MNQFIKRLLELIQLTDSGRRRNKDWRELKNILTMAGYWKGRERKKGAKARNANRLILIDNYIRRCYHRDRDK